MDGSIAPDGHEADDTWTVAGRTFRSRLIVGTGRYKDLEETGRAIEASGAEIVTVAVRRVNLSDASAPMLLSRRFTINPAAMILALIFWYWMWGVAGAILAVPLLAITKIVCDDLRPLRALGHLLEG